MRTFIGCIIDEGLTDTDQLAGLDSVAERTVDMPTDPDATLWHVRWYQLSERELNARLPALAAATRPHWYAHFWSGDDLCVILPGRFFWAKASDKATWRDLIAYGDTVGVERKWTESIPTAVPEWVRASMESSISRQGL